jgi:hypothetical protein
MNDSQEEKFMEKADHMSVSLSSLMESLEQALSWPCRTVNPYLYRRKENLEIDEEEPITGRGKTRTGSQGRSTTSGRADMLPSPSLGLTLGGSVMTSGGSSGLRRLLLLDCWKQ